MHYHASFNIANFLRCSPGTQGTTLTQNGRLLTADEAVALGKELLVRGYEVFPTCSHFDEKGYCAGHIEPEKTNATN